MLKLNLRLLGVITIFSILIACGKSGSVCKVPEVPAPKFQQDKTAQVFIFIDGTTSMKGFVKSPFSRYALFISNLESAINSTFPASDINYYKFGANIEEIPRDQYKKALKPEFYGRYSRKSQNITSIDVVLSSIDSMMNKDNEVFILITDLFQDDADIDKVISTIKKLKSKGTYLGIVAQKSKFDGKVYDVSEYKYSFKYSGNRPFYAIFIAKNPMNIIGIIQNLEKLSKQWDAHVLLFGDTLYYKNPEIELNKLSRAYKLSSNKLKVKDNAKIDFSLKIFPLTYAAYIPDSISTKTYDCRNYQTAEGISISTIDYLADEVKAKLTVEKLKSDALIEEFAVLSNKNLPGWIDDYDMDIRQLETWLSNPETFPGNTTYNLKKFMMILYGLYEPYFGKAHLILIK